MNKILLLDSNSGLNAAVPNGIQKVKLANHPSIIKFENTLENIRSISKLNNDVVIQLADGKQLVLDNFFSQANHLVINGQNESLLWVKFTDAEGNFIDPVEYEPIENIEALDEEAGSSGLMVLAPIIAGGIAHWLIRSLIDSDKDNSSSNPDDDDDDNGGGGGSNDAPVLQTYIVNEEGVIELTFDKNLDDDHLPLNTYFEITVDSVIATITAIGIDPSNPKKLIIKTDPPIYENSVVTLKYTDPTTGNDEFAIQSESGADAASFTRTLMNQSELEDDNNNNDDAPVIETAVVNSDGDRIVLTFDKDLDSTNLPDLNTFVVRANGQNIPVTSFEIVPETVNGETTTNTLILHVAPKIKAGRDVIIEYTDPTSVDDENAIQSTTGVDTDSFQTIVTNQSTYTGNPDDSDAPYLIAAEVNAEGVIELTFNEDLDDQYLPVANDFTILVGNQLVVITSITIDPVNASLVSITTSPTITVGQSVVVVYEDPSDGDDIYALQGTTGQDVEDFDTSATGGVPVENNSEVEPVDTDPPTLESAEVNTDGIIELTFSEDLDGDNLPDLEDFVIIVDDEPVVVTSIELDSTDPSKVIITTAPVITAGQDVVVQYTDPSAGNDPKALQDEAGNDVEDFDTSATGGVPVENNSEVEPADTDPPTLESAEVNTDGIIELTFSEDLDGDNLPDLEDFVITVDDEPVVVTAIELDSTDPYKVIITTAPVITAGQDVVVQYTDPSAGNDPKALQDEAGNDVQDFDTSATGGVPVENNSEVEPVDTDPPTLVTAEVNTDGIIELTFSEDLDGDNLPDLEDFVITVDDEPVVVTAIELDSTDPSKVIITTAPVITAGQDVVVQYTDPSAGNDPKALQDEAGNDVEDFDTSATGGVPVENNSEVEPADTDPPTLESAEVNTDGIIELTFSEDLDGDNLPDLEDFAIIVDDEPVVVTAIELDSTDPTKVIITTAPVITAGQDVVVQYTDPSAGNDPKALQDEAGNDVEDFDTSATGGVPVENNSEVEPVDTDPPTLVTAEVNTDGIIELTFSEDLDGDNLPDLEDFVITVDDEPVVVTAIELDSTDPSKVIITTAPVITAGQDVVVQYTDPSAGNDPKALQDEAGNDVEDFDTSATGGVPVENNSEVEPADTDPPTLESAEVNTDGIIELTFSEDLDGDNLPDLEDFVIIVDDEPVVVTSIELDSTDPTKVIITTAPVITAGQDVVVQYTDPSAGNDPKALQDEAGNDVEDFDTSATGGVPVENNSEVEPADTDPPTLESAEVNTDGIIELTFSEDLDGDNLPDLEDFAIIVDDEPVVVTAIELDSTDPSKVIITTAPVITAGQDVVVQYTDPSAGNDPKALQDEAGNDVEDFDTSATGGVPVENNSEVEPADTDPPTLESAEVNTDGIIELTFSEDLDGDNLPDLEDFAIIVDDEPVVVTAIELDSTDPTKVIITTAPVITAGQDVVVQYTDPSAGNDPKALQDEAGNDVQDFDTSATGGVPVENNSEVEPVDTDPPTLVTAEVNTDGIIELTFSEDLDGDNLPDLEDFVITVDDEPVVVTAIELDSTDPSKVIITTAPVITAGQDVVVQYTDPSAGNDPKALQDEAGNDVEDFDTSATGGVPVENNSEVEPADTDPPTLESAEVNTDGIIELTFSEDLDGDNLPDLEDFAIIVDDEPVVVTSIELDSTDPSKVIITTAPVITAGQDVVVQYTDPSPEDDPKALQDEAGNDVEDFDTSAGIGVENNSEIDPDAGPELLDFINGYLDMTLYFDKELDPDHLPLPEHFIVNTYDQTDGNGDPAPRQINIINIALDPEDPSTLILTFSEDMQGNNYLSPLYTAEVIYQDPTQDDDEYAIQDLNGRDAQGFEFEVTVAAAPVDPAPELVAAEVNADGLIILSFDQDIYAPRPPKLSDFVVKVDSVVVNVVSVSVVDWYKVVLVTSPVIHAGKVVIVTYTDPTEDDDLDAIQNYDEQDAESFTVEAVNNSEQGIVLDTAPELIRLEVNVDGVIELVFNEDIDADNLPALDDFIITVDGVVVPVQSISVDPSDASIVYVGTDPVISVGQVVNVIYKDPTTGDDDNALQDLNGNDVDTFVHSADNLSQVPLPDKTPPQLVKVQIIGDTGIELIFDESLDEINLPQISNFTIIVNGTVVSVLGLDVAGNQAHLIMADEIPLNANVQIIYADPTTANDTNALQDLSGNDVGSFVTSVVNTSVKVEITKIAGDDFVLNGTELGLGYIEISGVVTGLAVDEKIYSIKLTIQGRVFDVDLTQIDPSAWSTRIPTTGLNLSNGSIESVKVDVKVVDHLDEIQVKAQVEDEKTFTVDTDFTQQVTHVIHPIDGGNDYILNAEELSDGVVVLSGQVTSAETIELVSVLVEIIDPEDQSVVHTFVDNLITKNGLSWSISVSESTFDFSAYPDHQIKATATVKDSSGNTKDVEVTQEYKVDVVLDSEDTASITIDEIDGVDTVEGEFFVNQNELADGKITVSGKITGVTSPDYVSQLTVTITKIEGGQPVYIEVVLLNPTIVNGVWSVDLTHAGLNLQHRDQPEVKAVATIRDPAGNSTTKEVTQSFTVDTFISNPTASITGIGGNDFIVEGGDLVGGKVEITGQVSSLEEDEFIGDIQLNIVKNPGTPNEVSTVIKYSEDTAVDGIDWVVNNDGTWSVLIPSSMNFSDGLASLQAVIVLKDEAGNTRNLPASQDFEVNIGIVNDNQLNIDLTNDTTNYDENSETETFSSFTVLGLLEGANARGLPGHEFNIGNQANGDSIGKIELTMQVNSLLTVAKSFGVILQKQDINGDWVDYMSAPVGDKGIVASIGSQYALGAIGSDQQQYTLSFNGLPEGTYRVKTYGSMSELSELIESVELRNLGSGGYLLGKENQNAIIDAVIDVLQQGEPSPAVTELINLLTGILNVVNALTSPLSNLIYRLVNEPLLQPLFTILDQALDAVLTELLSNTVTLFEATEITITATEAFFNQAEFLTGDDDIRLNALADDSPGLILTGIKNQTNAAVDVLDTNEPVVVHGQYGKLTIASNGDYSYTLYPTLTPKAGMTDVFTYFASFPGETTQYSANITININGGTNQEIDAIDNQVGLTLDVTPNVIDLANQTTTAGGLAYIGLGSVLDLTALNVNRVLSINVANQTERKITFEAESGGIQILTDYDLFIYKLNTNTNHYELFMKQEKWFGVGLFGGKTNQGLTLDFESGQYLALLEPTTGINVAFGYTLKTTKDQLLDYANPVSVQGKAEGNVITDIDVQHGADSIPATGVYVTEVTANGVTLQVENNAVDEGTTIEGHYGTLTIFGNGDYIYTASNSKTFNYGDVDQFSYTIYDPVSGQSSQAQLSIVLNYIAAYQDIQTESVMLNILPLQKNIANVDLNNAVKNDVTMGKSAATAFGVAAINLGQVIDTDLISSTNSIAIKVDTGELVSMKFKATGYETISIGGSYDLHIYKKNEHGQLELYYNKSQFLTIPLSLLIPIGGIYNTPINMTFTEGEYYAYLTSASGVGIIGGATLSVSDIQVQDFNTPAIYQGDLEGQIDLGTETLHSVNGRDFSGTDPVVIVGKYGTLIVQGNGTYTYQVDPSLTQPPFGKIDTFSYVSKNSANQLTTHALNIKISTVDANKDLILDGGGEHLIAAVMTNKTETLHIEDASKTLNWGQSFTKNIHFTVTDLNALQTLNFTLNGELTVKLNNYNTSMEYQIYRLDESNGSITRVLFDQKTSNAVKNLTTLSTTINSGDLIPGNYVIELKVNGYDWSNTKYSYDLDIHQVYLDQWTPISGTNYNTETVTGNFLTNDHFSDGLKNQSMIKFGFNYLSLDPSKATQTIQLTGKYGNLIVKSDGSYTYTPNGKGGGRDVFEYEIISPTGETDRSTIEFNIGKVVTGSEGNDSIESGAANDTYTMGAGSDTVIFDILNRSHENGGNGFDTWTDFNVGANSDKVDISGLLTNYDTSKNIYDYVYVYKSGADLIISIDRDGVGQDYAQTDLVKLTGVANHASFTSSNEQQILDLLLSNQQIILH
ncbi:BapA/Bap/LapF family large adhesin [Acinetobacter shaoyimingii]|uniref:Biofilm-associated protein BapA-like prefix-like domain-containing protein n=1 Tax=Acinetobacter shaoyimingii TaxID=2715164 RepID=A0A6G8RW12_9GAMM|nr:BapA/Bap/LapF family large adhesin [Acinetobacter shaoyimingii]QIO06129.1 hypothetical protein G8E00_09255 [Acinetobacter shaoyimingii]